MLTVHHSNRLERLLDRLVAVTAAGPADPLAPEVVVTQSRGMARWVAFGLAERRGVAANLRFELPAAFIWRVFQSQSAERLPDLSGFDRDALTWRLMGLLPAWVERPGFEPLAGYLAGPRPERRRFQLCRRIADLFDQYLIYRPQMVLDWEAGAGGDDDWQAQLWRALTAGAAVPHRARLIAGFVARSEAGLDPARLPPRVCIFGIPTLPPAYLDVLRRVAEAVEVHLFLLNPSQEYWGDIEEPRRLARLRRREGEAAAEHRESGNPLLASWGRQGRDFFDALVAGDAEFVDDFVEPGEASLLAAIQGDILRLDDRRDADGSDGADGSLQVHACHGPMREVEVLHDRLLALFDADPSLSPRDVVVMTPDIERYAPYLEAVFGAAPRERHIPFAIADLSRRSEQPVVRAFLQLLETVTSRFTASEVLGLLEVPAVQRRFGLDQEALEAIRRWVREVNIRWGLDGAARGGLDLPATEGHTWAFGLRRLFLGFALPPEERLFGGVLPYPEIEGQGAAALGRLQRFLDGLTALRGRLNQARSATEWALLLNELLEGFFATESDDAEPLRVIREAIAAVVDETERAGYGGRFGLDVLGDDLRGRLAEPSAGQHFLTGRVTFCAMLPMRSLPFRVVCLIGMNDQAFPRRQRPVGFDKMAQAPRPGDRSRREDDRTLFLEALLSARERFYVSYVGRNARDNSAMLPSVLLSELLDYVEQGWGRAVRESVVREHPLQPFSARAFGDGAAFSYAAEWLPGIAARAGERGDAAPFCPAPLPPLPDAERRVELAELVRFFRHPGRAFLRQRLGISLAAEEAAVADDEPFQLAGPDGWALRDEALERLLAGDDPAAHRTLLAARGHLPEGEFGPLDYTRLTDGLAGLADRLRPHLADPAGAVEVDLPLGDWRLTGWVQSGPQGLVRYRAGKLSPLERIAFWIEHLALCAARGGRPVRSRYFATDADLTVGPVAAAHERLTELVRLYAEGQGAPLAFFPNSAWEFVKPVDGRTKRPAIDRARSVWLGSEWNGGEGDDPSWRLAFRGNADPLDDRFVAAAETVFGPMLAAEVGDE